MLSILPGGGGQLGKDGFVMLLARWRDSTNMKLHRRRVGVFWKFIQYGVGWNLGNCVFIINLTPDLGKPAFLILRNENMRVPWPGDCAKNSKLKNVGFSLSPHFRIFYILTPDPPRWRPDMLWMMGVCWPSYPGWTVQATMLRCSGLW